MSNASIVREWTRPDGSKCVGGSEDNAKAPPGSLMLYNSLLDEKVPFVPASGPGSKSLSWYTCGPTVYDVSHMGHARNYVTFDIIRRVLEDYFGYNILYVMNVTDVNDKIIIRARRNYLLAKYKEGKHTDAEVKAFAEKAVQNSFAKQRAKLAEAEALVVAANEEQEAAAADKKGVLQRQLNELEGAIKNEAHKLSQIQTAMRALGQAGDSATIYAVASDFVAEELDKEQGKSVTDSSIFRAHAAKYEAEFTQDMDSLGVRRPDVLTRVSEYMDEIVDYVKKIVDNGMAYESNGTEGESNFETSEKRSNTDFALWKASKPGEPFWESPWGHGRPGWHIECSAMASTLIGSRMDIHTGGDDLRFPHHDNELAQAEAFYHNEGCHQWVNYFLHSGHLEIEGLKMSKSLKNFITIREALKSFSARQLRLLFVLQSWNKSMVYGEASRAEMKAREAQLKNFFQNIEVAVRGVDEITSCAKWQAEERDLSQKLQAAQNQVHEHLLDNLNTAAVMDTLSELIKSTNIYLFKKRESASAAAPAQPFLLRKVATYVTRMLSMFGIVDASWDKPGFADAAGGAGDAKGAGYLDAFAAFRDEVRSLARTKADPKETMTACDRVRDVALVELGVRLEDRPDGKVIWKLDDPAVINAEQQERAKTASEARSFIHGGVQSTEY
eukprot:gene27085-biopygen836